MARRIEDSIDIRRPVEEVFAYLADVRNLPEWTGGAIEFRSGRQGPIQDGALYTAVGHFMGRSGEGAYRAFVEPPRLIVFESASGPVPHQFILALEPHGAGTRVIYIAEGEPGNAFRLALPLVERTLRRKLSSDLATLRHVLEGQG